MSLFKDRYGYLQGWVWAAIITVAMLAVLGVSVLLGIGLASKKCDQVSAITDKPVRWDVWSGCYVQHGDQMIPYERWLYLTGEK